MPNERKKGKHLNFNDRMIIQDGLRLHKSFREIADDIGCTPETVSKEIQIHRYCKEMNAKNTVRLNYCKYRDTCKRRNVCNKPSKYKCKIPCRKCTSCNKLCPDYIFEPCKIANKAPYVCNGCRKHSCMFDRYLYSAAIAQKEYEAKLSRSRQGINMTRDEMAVINEIVSPLLLQGQPLTHIYHAHTEEITCSIRSLYNYINRGFLTAKRMDLRRAVRYKKRKKQDEEPIYRPRKNKEGHKYKDFLAFVEAHQDASVVEMDTVEGVKGGKLLQTFLFRNSNLGLAFLIDSKEMENTVATLDRIEEALGTELFKQLFQVILTDNGSEFANPDLFEINKDGEYRTKLFYCEPKHSEQKGALEKNHEYIRYLLPKGTDFAFLTQEKVLLMMNHINSVKRKSLEWQTPYEAAEAIYGKEPLDKLGLRNINARNVCLIPKLLK